MHIEDGDKLKIAEKLFPRAEKCSVAKEACAKGPNTSFY